MVRYRGYYIDHVVFNSKREIDEQIREDMARSYAIRVRAWLREPGDNARLVAMTDMMRCLLDAGFSGEEIERIEMEA